jgi:ribulose-5-phosphate 4-epimerase/fuculose-1-phosphate aldolase
VGGSPLTTSKVDAIVAGAAAVYWCPPQSLANLAANGMAMQESDARQQIVLGCRILSHRRLVEGFGHISVRLDDGTVLVTPRKALLLVEAEEIIRLTTDGQVLGGTGAAPVETNMHLAVYRRRPDVQAIARTHSFTTSAFASMGRPIRAVHNFGTHLGEEVPIYPDIALVATPERAESVADALGSHDAVLLRGNGTLVTAPTLTEAVMRAVWLEESATLQATILAAGGQPTYFTPEEVARRRVMDMPHEPVRAWDYEIATLGPAAGPA